MTDESKTKLPIKGLQKTSLIDYAPYTSAVIYIGGCNFRCPYCHNFDLVLRPNEVKSINEEEIIDFLVDRKKWIDALVITGGEPTLYLDLKRFIKRVKDLGLRVKLDTNGTNPDLLWDLIEEKLVDYVAMDIKAPLAEYENVTMIPTDLSSIKRSIALLMNSNIDHEFRTTVHRNYITKKNILELVRPIEGAKKFVIQNFRGKMGVLDDLAFKGTEPYKRSELEILKKIVEPMVQNVEIRD